MTVTTTETVAAVRDLTAGYGRVPAIRGISFEINAGEVVVLLGPNGAGKTTTLLAMMNLIPSMGGEIDLPGRTSHRTTPAKLARSGVQFVPDDRGLCSGLTVAEHFKLAGRASGPEVDSVLEHFPALRGLWQKKAGLLSGGEQQMLAIAKALVVDPTLVMIDELSLGLAPKMVASIYAAARGLAHDRGLAFLLVEQHTDIALSVADKALVLNHGEVVLAGTGAELRADRAALKAAYFGG